MLYNKISRFIKPFWLTLLGAPLLSFSFHPTSAYAQAADLVALGIEGVGGAAGYAIGKAINPKSTAAAGIGTGLGAVIAQVGYDAFKNNANRKQLDAFMAGQDYERWIRSEKHWYDLTLDPNPCLQEAFSGLNYGPTLKPPCSTCEPGKAPDGSDQLQDVTPYNPVIVGEGTYNGVYRTKRVLWFPTLQ